MKPCTPKACIIWTFHSLLCSSLRLGSWSNPTAVADGMGGLPFMSNVTSVSLGLATPQRLSEFGRQCDSAAVWQCGLKRCLASCKATHGPTLLFLPQAFAWEVYPPVACNHDLGRDVAGVLRCFWRSLQRSGQISWLQPRCVQLSMRCCHLLAWQWWCGALLQVMQSSNSFG